MVLGVRMRFGRGGWLWQQLLLFLLLLLLVATYFLAGSLAWLSTVTGMVISADWMAGLGRGASTVSMPSGDSEDRTAVASTPAGRLQGKRGGQGCDSPCPNLQPSGCDAVIGDRCSAPNCCLPRLPLWARGIPSLPIGHWRGWVGGQRSPKTSGPGLPYSLVLTCIFG